jgi:prepilin-type N-terminal cleavage/methylation domain-containing protein
MESIDDLKRPGIMAKLRNSKGFSLIEMAIVLVIIGVIIAAIIKGQDLILNSQAKKVAAAASGWRNACFAFMDRNGRFPGDENHNGIIGDQAAGGAIVEEKTDATSAVAELSVAGIMADLPPNPVVVGSSSFWFYIGNTTTTDSGARNAMLICGSVDCRTPFTTDQIEILKSVDTAFDGSADSGLGQFRIASGLAAAAPPVLNPNPPAVLVNNRMTATFSGVAIVSVPNTSTGTAALGWASSANNTAAIWLFDKPY